MVYLAAAIVVVGSLCVFDLVLSLGVVRRLREHTEVLNSLTHGGPPAGADAIPVGETVGEFAATTVDDEPVLRELLVTPTLVGFFSPGCKPCATELPRFVERATAMPHGAGQALAVIDAETDRDAIDYAEHLRPVAQVVVQGHRDDGLQAAFGVVGYPTFYLVGAGGTVLAHGDAMSSLGGVPGSDGARA
jgi:hypothetical protein